MFTSSYYEFKGAGRVGISRGTPRGIPGGYRKYAPLAPDASWFYTPEAEDQQTYRDLYFAQLSKLDPARVIADLHRLAGDCAVPTLQCFCRLQKPGSWCHRTFAAEYITEKTGLAVIELTPTSVRAIQESEQLHLF